MNSSLLQQERGAESGKKKKRRKFQPRPRPASQHVVSMVTQQGWLISYLKEDVVGGGGSGSWGGPTWWRWACPGDSVTAGRVQWRRGNSRAALGSTPRQTMELLTDGASLNCFHLTEENPDPEWWECFLFPQDHADPHHIRVWTDTGGSDTFSQVLPNSKILIFGQMWQFGLKVLAAFFTVTFLIFGVLKYKLVWS